MRDLADPEGWLRLARPIGGSRGRSLSKRCERALGRVGGAGEDLRMHERLAVGAQLLERGGVAAALGQAVPAVAERVRARGQPRVAAE